MSEFGGDRATRPGGWLARVGTDLPLRAATGITLAAVALGVAWVGGFPFLAFWGLASAGVAWEWQRLIGGSRLAPRVAICVFGLVAAAPLARLGLGLRATFLLAMFAIATGLIADPGRRLAAAAGVAYSGALFFSVTALRASPVYGLIAILWLFAVVWGADVAAYFAGRLIGGPKLWPRVSPGKTWSGAIVGAAAGAALGVVVVAFAGPRDSEPWSLLPLGIVIAVASQLGDLFESALKRHAGVKDSSRLIPGHGGLMDRLDGFIFAAALAALVASARSTGTWIASGLMLW